MKQFALGFLIATGIMFSQASMTWAGDDNYSVNSGQGNTTLKAPHTKTDKTFGDEEKRANEEAKEKKEKAEENAVNKAAEKGSNISTEDLYNHSKQGGGTKFDVDPPQQH